MPKDFMDDYVDVATRINLFYERYPEGRLACDTWSTVRVGEKDFVVVEAKAFRSPDDSLPGVGLAWEPLPGTTPFTRNSELMVCQTSAWGRAIVALGGFDTKIASADELRNRQYDDRHYGPPMPKVPPFDVPVFNIMAAEHGITKEQIAKALDVPPSKLQKGIDLRTAAQAWAMTNNLTSDVEMALVDAIRKDVSDAT